MSKVTEYKFTAIPILSKLFDLAKQDKISPKLKENYILFPLFCEQSKKSPQRARSLLRNWQKHDNFPLFIFCCLGACVLSGEIAARTHAIIQQTQFAVCN
jgi:hypothetical protein